MRLSNDWDCNIVKRNKTITITFTNVKTKKKIEVIEKLEMAGFGIDDYHPTYLNYLLNNELGIELEDQEYKPTKYY